MAKRKFTFEVLAKVEVSLDRSLLPDNEWRSTFYKLNTLEEVAAHFAYNAAANGVDDISKLDGFADRDKSLCQLRVSWDDPELLSKANKLRGL